MAQLHGLDVFDIAGQQVLEPGARRDIVYLFDGHD